jgi:hypothetical protein
VGTVTIRTRGYIAGVWAFEALLVAVLVATALGPRSAEVVRNPPLAVVVGGSPWPPEHRGWSTLATAILAVLVLVGLRAYRLSVVVTDSEVTVRTWFFTRRIPRADVTRVAAAPYRGILLRGWQSRYPSTILVVTEQETVEARCLLTGPQRAECLATRISALVGVAPSPLTPDELEDYRAPLF